MKDFKKIAVLDNTVEAQLLSSVLEDREIPHRIRSYHDSAMNGLYQMGRGWGRVEAPPEFEKEIQNILTEIKQQAESALDEEQQGE